MCAHRLLRKKATDLREWVKEAKRLAKEECWKKEDERARTEFENGGEGVLVGSVCVYLRCTVCDMLTPNGTLIAWYMSNR